MTTNTQQAEMERKLLVLVAEVKGTPIMARLNAYVARFSPAHKPVASLAEFLAANLPEREKYIVTRNLVDILLAKDYDRLPQLKAGPESVPAGLTDTITETATEIPEDDFEPAPTAAELRVIVRAEIRAELADVFEKIARALKP